MVGGACHRNEIKAGSARSAIQSVENAVIGIIIARLAGILIAYALKIFGRTAVACSAYVAGAGAVRAAAASVASAGAKRSGAGVSLFRVAVSVRPEAHVDAVLIGRAGVRRYAVGKARKPVGAYITGERRSSRARLTYLALRRAGAVQADSRTRAGAGIAFSSVVFNGRILTGSGRGAYRSGGARVAVVGAGSAASAASVASALFA